MESSRWSFFRRSKKDPSKKKKKKKEEMPVTAGVSCGISPASGECQATGNPPGYLNTPRIQSPPRVQLQQPGYQPGAHRCARRETPAAHDSLGDLSVAEALTLNEKGLQRCRSQPSIVTSPKKSQKKNRNPDTEQPVTGGAVPPTKNPDTEQPVTGGAVSPTKRAGLGSWLRKSLRRSKSKNDVSNKKKKGSEFNEQWGKGGLSRAVSTGVVTSSSRCTSLGNLLQDGTKSPAVDLEAPDDLPSAAGRGTVPPVEDCSGKAALRPYVLSLPPRPKRYSLPAAPCEQLQYQKHQLIQQVQQFQQHQTKAVGAVRGSQCVSVQDVIQRHSDMIKETPIHGKEKAMGLIVEGSRPQVLQDQPYHVIGSGVTTPEKPHGPHPQRGERTLDRLPSRENSGKSQNKSTRVRGQKRSKTPEGRALPSCQNVHSPQPLLSQKQTVRPQMLSFPVGSSSSPRTAESPVSASTLSPLTGPERSHMLGISRGVSSPVSPVSPVSGVSSSVSSVGMARANRELPPVPLTRVSVVSSSITSQTTSECIYHQIQDVNVAGFEELGPGLPWQPPSGPLRVRTASVDNLDQSRSFGQNTSRRKRTRSTGTSTLKRAVSQPFLDQSNQSSACAQYFDLEHVKSACDLTLDSMRPELHNARNLRSNKKYLYSNSADLLDTVEEKHNVPLKSRSSYDLSAKKDARRESRSRSGERVRGSDPMTQYRSQPQFGGPGIQSRESLAFKPLSHTSSDESLSSCSSDSDVERTRRTRQKRVRRRPKRRSQSSGNIPELTERAGSSIKKWSKWPYLSKDTSYMLKRWWATVDDLPSAVLQDRSSFASTGGALTESVLSEPDVSMATTASYVPGVSLADKLRLAASKGQLEKVKELILAGGTLEPDREGRTALHYAALNGYADVASLLAAEGCDIDSQDSLGYTALHRAAAQGHLDVIKALLAEGCLVDRQDEVHGNAALHEAAWNGYSKTLELLVKNRCNVSISNKAGFSALHLAAQNGHNQSARVMLYASSNADVRNNYGDTPLHTAARYGHAGVTRILVSAKANVNEQNKNGDTALHIAAALKRRKITKLLCESVIDVNIRNKQNETGVDVARRKEHPEIILIITSKPKIKQKKRRFGRSKPAKGYLSDDGEKKAEKRGFFFRRKKAKEKEKSNPALTAASEVSSSRYVPSQYTDTLPPAHLMPGYRQPHQGAHQPPGVAAALSAHAMARSQARGTSTAGSMGGKSKDGMSAVSGQHQCNHKKGMQYYRDLAGNVKQGPVGFTQSCQCAPLVKRLEQRVEADRANLYDHIDASHRTLTDRIDQLDRRTAQQVYSIDKLTKERMEAERKEREEHVDNRALAERLETERQLEVQQDCMKTELKAWVDSRLTGFERKYSSHDDGCDYLLNSNFNFGRDGLHQTNLFRSKSDETLSISSSHPSRKYHKLHGRNAHELKKVQQQTVANSNRAHRLEKKMHSRRSGLTVRDRPLSYGDPRLRCAPVHENGRPLGHSPEGQSTKNDSFNENSPVDRPLPEWIKPSPAGANTPRHYEEAEGNSYSTGSRNIGVRFNALALTAANSGELENSGGVSKSDTHLDDDDTPPRPQPPAHFVPGAHMPRSFTVQAQVHHAKTDSGSNPDSGYGGKTYGGRNGGNRSGSDQHDTSIATSISTTTDGTSGTSEGDPLHVTRHFFDTVSAQMEKWYERRLKEVEKKAEDRVSQESSAMQTRIQALEEKINKDKNVKLGPQIEASIGTQV